MRNEFPEHPIKEKMALLRVAHIDAGMGFQKSMANSPLLIRKKVAVHFNSMKLLNLAN